MVPNVLTLVQYCSRLAKAQIFQQCLEQVFLSKTIITIVSQNTVKFQSKYSCFSITLVESLRLLCYGAGGTCINLTAINWPIRTAVIPYHPPGLLMWFLQAERLLSCTETRRASVQPNTVTPEPNSLTTEPAQLHLKPLQRQEREQLLAQFLANIFSTYTTL